MLVARRVRDAVRAHVRLLPAHSSRLSYIPAEGVTAGAVDVRRGAVQRVHHLDVQWTSRYLCWR